MLAEQAFTHWPTAPALEPLSMRVRGMLIEEAEDGQYLNGRFIKENDQFVRRYEWQLKDVNATTTVRVLQGKVKTLSFWTRGLAEVLAVEGESVNSWSVRWDAEKKRYIEIQIKEAKEPTSDHTFKIRMQSKVSELPSSHQITNLAPGNQESAGFNQVISLNYLNGVEGRVTKIQDFLPVGSEKGKPNQFQTVRGGEFVVQLNRAGATPSPVRTRVAC